MTEPRTRRPARWWQIALLFPLIPILMVLAAIALACFVVASICLHVTIWTIWCLRGRDILLVYSDSPIWHDYIQEAILPKLGARAVVLNWSHRKRWRLSLARLAFHHFGGYRQFNPMAVVFRPFRRSKIFRFWQPFKDFKHGRTAPLHRMESEFFDLVRIDRGSA
jgi:hypothetical protein